MNETVDSNGQRLANHWTKPRGVVGYYWFLTFEKSERLHSLVDNCWTRLPSCYNPVPRGSLHSTIDRVAGAGELSTDQLRAIQAGARVSLGEMAAFELAVGGVRRVPSALICDVAPAAKIGELRSRLRDGTVDVVSGSCAPPNFPVPHLTVAYANSDGIAPPEADEAVAMLNRSSSNKRLKVSEVSLVLLHRRRAMYSWDLIERNPLGRSN